MIALALAMGLGFGAPRLSDPQTIDLGKERMGCAWSPYRGSILVAGGYDYAARTCSATSLIFTSKNGARSGPKLLTGRNHFGLVPTDGGVLAVGGYSEATGDSVRSIELLTKGGFKVFGELPEGRELFTTGRFQGQRYLFGGLNAGEPSVPKSVIQIWPKVKAVGELNEGRFGHATLWIPKQRKFLIIGGKKVTKLAKPPHRYEALKSLEWWDPLLQSRVFAGTGRASAAGNLETSRDRPGAALLPNGKVLIFGGANDQNETLDSMELFDPETNRCEPVKTKLAAPRMAPLTLPFRGGMLVAGGGSNNPNAAKQIEWIDLKALVSHVVGQAEAPRAEAAMFIVGGRLYLVGGKDDFKGRAPHQYKFSKVESWRID